VRATQRTSNNLFAQELGAEGTNAENMGHGIGIPSLGEHRDGHDTADGTAKLSGLADSVHNLAEQFLIADVVACMSIPGALHDFTAETLDLVSSHAAESCRQAHRPLRAVRCR
jgi:hypothetical protein